jgi:two-component system NtrC family sensor kinase
MKSSAVALIHAFESVVRGDLSVRIDEEGDADGLARAFNAMIASIGEREHRQKESAKEQIFQSEKLASIGRLASGIAHEINNPLTGILTYSSMMLVDMKDTQYAEDIKIIIDEAIRCRDIVSGLLDFSRETHPELRPANLNYLITETLSILEKTHSLSNVVVEKILDDKIPAAGMDTNQMKSVINNLVLNAVDAMPLGGTIKIRTGIDKKAGKIFMEVEDNGSGIKKENIGLIFDPCFTSKDVGRGTGLGLFVTYNIVERHGGIIKVQSEEGIGTTFTVELPVK